MMLATRNHKQIKMTSRSHSMPPRRRSDKIDIHEQYKYSPSLRAEAIRADKTLQQLLEIEISKARVVTQQGYNAVYSRFLQSQVVTNVVKKREDEKKGNAHSGRRTKNTNPFRFGAGRQIKSNIKQVVPIQTEACDYYQTNLARRKSDLSENEHTHFKKPQMCFKDSCILSYKSKDEGTGGHAPRSRNGVKSKKNIEVKEIIVADNEFKRSNSSSSLQLREIFPDIDSEDDETSSTSSSYASSFCSSYSTDNGSTNAPNSKSREISADKKTAWLPWPKKNNGDSLLVSFSKSVNDSSTSFLEWPQEAPSSSWERHCI
eukprot:scaffold62141_cov46-Cyclotella_meneghiniana.AAC.4